MGDSVQFRLNVLEETPTTQEPSGKHVRFRLTLVTEKSTKSRKETFVKLEETVKAEWNWVDERCIICYGLIKPGTQEFIWKCPHCGKVAHFDHVESWIRDKHKCPVCRQPVHI